MVKHTTSRLGRRNDSLGSGLGPQGRTLFGRIFGSKPGATGPTTHHEATNVAIASGKGGTGKSFFATSLAVVLHQQLHQVTLTDCDFGLACDHLLLGVTPKQTLQHVLSGHARVDEVRMDTPSGPTLVPGGSGIMQMASLTDRQLLVLGRALGEIATMDDVQLLDVGAGIAPQNVLTLLAADHVVMVTQPEIAALTDAYAVIKCCAGLRQDIDFSVVVNRVVTPGQGDATFEKLAQVAHRHVGIEISYLGEIGEDPMVTQRRLGQQPLVVSDPDRNTSQAIRRIAQRLEQVAAPIGRRQVNTETCLEARFKAHRLFLG